MFNFEKYKENINPQIYIGYMFVWEFFGGRVEWEE